MKTLCLLSLVLLGAGAIAAEETSPLTALKTAYETKRTALTAERDATVGKALDAYKTELGTLLANVRQQGNLDYVLAIEAEQKRLAAGGGAPTEPAAKEFAHLRRIQWAARQTEDKADKELDDSLAKLRKQYLDSLGKLEKDLVAANRIEEAKAVREEKERMEAMQEICGEWLWVGKYHRTVKEDGTISETQTGESSGTWRFLGFTPDGERRYQTDFYGGRFIDTVTLSADGKTLSWDQPGRHFSAVRED